MKKSLEVQCCLLLLCTVFLGELRAQNTRDTEALFDLSFDEDERKLMKKGLEENLSAYKALHAYSINNSVPPAVQFNQIPIGFELNTEQSKIDWGLSANVDLPDNLEELAFYTVAELSVLIKSRKITSQQLTQIYLDRLKKHGDTLQCVITITEELALKQARKADEEISAGNYRGPLHGIPYGAKDLLAVKGYKTTWEQSHTKIR